MPDEYGSVRVVEQPEGQWLVELSGEFDLGNISQLDAALAAIPPGSRAAVDLSGTEFVDSSTLGTLVRAQRRLGHDGANDAVVLVVPPDSRVRRIFEIAGLDDVLPIVSQRGAAPRPG